MSNDYSLGIEGNYDLWQMLDDPLLIINQQELSHNFVVEGDRIFNCTTGEITMARPEQYGPPVIGDISGLSDEDLATQEDAFAKEALRRKEEMVRRRKSAVPNFTRFYFEAQYKTASSSHRRSTPHPNRKLYEFVGIRLAGGSVYVTGGTSHNSWLEFMRWVNTEFLWVSDMHELVESDGVFTAPLTGPGRNEIRDRHSL